MRKLLNPGAILFLGWTTLGAPLMAQVQPAFELNSALMGSTFKIEGRNSLGQPTVGTGFV